MITLYKQIETKGLYYKEMWYENADKVLIEHSGKVGYVGTIAKTSMTEKEAAIRLQDFSNVCASEGYTKLSENQLCTIVVQYLLKSRFRGVPTDGTGHVPHRNSHLRQSGYPTT